MSKFEAAKGEVQTKYLFVVGGVMSGVGKGVSTASVAMLLQARGLRVSAMKIDPYINVDAGTMNPQEHGEVFVTDDGDETDQDIGNYERFLGRSLGKANYLTTGRVYQQVIRRERNLEYGGKCVEVVPHIPLEVIERVKEAGRPAGAGGEQADIVIVEIGGTLGEYQNVLFLEAARMMKLKQPRDVGFMLVSYLPVPGAVGEMKSKPTQYAIRTMNSSGLTPDFVIGRAVDPLPESLKEKIGNVTGIEADRVVSAPDVDSIYEVPLVLAEQGLDSEIMEVFGLEDGGAARVAGAPSLDEWKGLVGRVRDESKMVKIAVVGKYFETDAGYALKDAYISVLEALKHAGWSLGVNVELDWVNSEEFEGDSAVEVGERLGGYAGVLVPGGYGSRGIEGKIRAIRWCREYGVPFFGICYGMQMAVVEFARNVLGLKGAHTVEIDAETADPVIHTMADQKEALEAGQYGGTMRLGAYGCELREGSLVLAAYEGAGWLGGVSGGEAAVTGVEGAEGVNTKSVVSERHRHRYEVNDEYRERLEKAGMRVSGVNPESGLVEIVELDRGKHPFFVGVQFHPELKSRPLGAHPLFVEFVRASVE